MASLKEKWFRIKTAWNILTGKYHHFTIITYTKSEFVNVLCDCKSRYHKVVCNMPDFVFYKAVKRIASEISDTDLVIEKANFQLNYIDEEVEETPR